MVLDWVYWRWIFSDTTFRQIYQAYDGTTKDFQMIVPENEATGTEPYYFYREL
ncbi:MAG: hypothetical protein ACXQTJ_03535 [Candidatus Syntropharchaeales archaeon]